MIQNDTFLTDLLNCISWLALTGALIYAIVIMSNSVRDVKIALKEKINIQTEIIKNKLSKEDNDNV